MGGFSEIFTLIWIALREKSIFIVFIQIYKCFVSVWQVVQQEWNSLIYQHT